MTQPLTVMLARVGLVLATRGPWARLRGVALAGGAATVALGIAGLTLQAGYAAQRQARADAIRPHVAASADQATSLYAFNGFTDLNDRPVVVISIWPVRPDAPPPPGVAHWPQPGQAVVSPAVLDDLGPGRASQFGPVAGVIAASGLEVPRERRVYLRPSRDVLSVNDMQPVARFGVTAGSSAALGVGVLYAAPHWQVNALVIAGLVVPGLVALALAAGLDGESRERRTRLLAVLGASRRHQVVVEVAEAAPAIAVGSLLTAAVLAVMCAVDIPLTPLDAVLPAADARTIWPGLVLAVLGAAVLAVLTVVAVRLRPRRRGRRVVLTSGQAPSHLRAGACLAALGATVWVPTYSDSAQVRTLAYVFGVLAVAVTLPALVGIVLTGAGDGAARWGLRRGSAGALGGGRRLQRFPRRTTRLALGVCFGVLTLGQVQLWASQLGAQYHDAVAVREDLGAVAAVANNTSYSAGTAAYLAALPSSVHAVWLSVEQDTAGGGPAPARTRLAGSCASLASLRLACTETSQPPSSPTPALAQLQRWGPGGALHVVPDRTGSLQVHADRDAQLALVAPPGQQLPLDDLQRAAYGTVAGGLQLQTLGQGWVTAGNNLLVRAGWTIALGLVGVLVLTLATACAMAGDVIASTRDLAPLTALSGRRGWLYVLTFWRTAVPLAVAGLLGSVVYLVAPSGLSRGAWTMSPSSTLAAGCTVGAALLGVALSVWAARQVAHRGSRWHPSLGE